MQSAYIGKLMELAQQDANILHILADSGTGYDEMFRHHFPRQIFNFGIGEENMVAVAAGMATVGKIPFVFTAGAFLAYRALEFIRDDVCFQNLNVKLVGMGSGLAWSSLGPTHHTTEDLAVLRSLPHLTVLSPATPKQVAECVELAYQIQGPVYIRIGMNQEKEFFGDDYHMEPVKLDVLRTGGDVAVFSTGSILEEADAAVSMLEADGIPAFLVSAASIKPFDGEGAKKIAEQVKLIVTVEEHNVTGGLGTLLSEIFAAQGILVRQHRIGLADVFAQGYGSQKEVRRQNGLDAEGIYQSIREVLGRE